jgi:polyisoprenoid-binding protein YceI
MNPAKNVAVALLALAAALSSRPGAALSNPATYRVEAGKSQFHVKVGRAGLFKAFGHDHLIAVERFTGSVEWSAESPEASRFNMEVDAASLKVVDDEVSEGDRAKIQGDMEAKALALPENPGIRFESSQVAVERVEGGSFHVKVTGTLSLRGVGKPFVIPLTLTVADDHLTAKGEVELPSDQWGVPQITAVGGSVRTKENLELTFDIVAVRE